MSVCTICGKHHDVSACPQDSSKQAPKLEISKEAIDTFSELVRALDQHFIEEGIDINNDIYHG